MKILEGGETALGRISQVSPPLYEPQIIKTDLHKLLANEY